MGRITNRTKARQLSRLDYNALYTMCYDYLMDNFSKFSKSDKIRVSQHFMSKSIDSKIAEDTTGDKYITNIVNNYTPGYKFTPGDKERVRARIAELAQKLNSRRPLSDDRRGTPDNQDQGGRDEAPGAKQSPKTATLKDKITLVRK